MKPFQALLRSSYIAIMLVLATIVPVYSPVHAATVNPSPISPNTPLRFTSLTLEQGLSQSIVNVTFQDSQGYLWFGTQDGLNRYDGYHFTIFRPDPDNPSTLNDRIINTLTEDTQGSLWIGTTLGGLNRYDRLTGLFTHLVHDPGDPDSLGGNFVRTLLVDTDGRLWIGSDGGLDVFDPERNTFSAHYRHDPTVPTSLPSNDINHLHQDRSGWMWVATDAGLAYQEHTGDPFTRFVYDPDDPAGLMSNQVNAIFEDQGGDLWLGTDMGLERLDRQRLTFEHFKRDHISAGSLSNIIVNAILEDRSGNLWVGTADGLNLLDRHSGRFTIYRHKIGDPTSLSNSTILSLYEDREGILWIGTFGGGVNIFDQGRNKFPFLQYDPSDPKNISSFGLIEDHTGQLWFTIYGSGLLRLNRETGEYTLYRQDPTDPENSLLDNFVWTVNESRDGTIWIGGSQGLNALDPETGQFTHYVHSENTLDDPYRLNSRVAGYTLEDKRGNIWIAMPAGLDCLDRNTGIITHYKHDPTDPTSLSSSNVAYIFESQEGDIWLGMYESGLSKLDVKTGQFTHYRYDPNDPGSLSSDQVIVIMQDHTGRMWLGTNEGLNQFNQSEAVFTHYTVKDGLPNDVIYGIVEDEQGYLWMSTNYGIARFDPGTLSFQNYDYTDGLQSNEFSTYAFAETRAGEIIFAGIAGANIFLPDQIRSNTYVPPIVLTQLTQGGEAIEAEQMMHSQQRVTLRWPYNYFEFEFASLSFSNPEKNHYAYYLENFDQAWVDNGTYNFGRYTNLPGGTYTLYIKGSNNDSVWNEDGMRLGLKVVPPVWQTWWFRSLVVLVLAVGVFAAYRLRIRNIERYSRDLQRQVDERTREIESLFEQTKDLAIIEERNRLARDLHDSAKQKAFAALAQLGAVRSIISREPVKAMNHLDEVEDLVYEVIQELTFLIQEMYPMALKEKGLHTTLREYLYEWENHNNIRVNLNVKQERRLALEIEQALYRICQESLANIARHSHASRVSIDLNYNDADIEMLISDNGIGFDFGQKPAGVGLRTMEERAIMIGGSLEISTSPGLGTGIRVRAPIKIVELPILNGDNGGQHGSPNHHPDRR